MPWFLHHVAKKPFNEDSSNSNSLTDPTSTTSVPGWIRIEIQDATGNPIPVFALTDCPEIVGDEIDRNVAWKGGTHVSAIAGRSIRPRLVMKAADLYSIRFTEREPAR